MNEEEQKEEIQQSLDQIEETEAAVEETEETVEESAAEPLAEEPEKSQTGEEVPSHLEKQPTQMFIAKKKEEEKLQKPSWRERLKNYLVECRRVLKVTKKPNKIEFTTIVKVSGLGILVIGLIGFMISIAKELLF